MTIHVENKQNLPVDVGVLKQVMQRVLGIEGWRQAEVSVLITDADGIKTLNKRYRNQDKATNVLAFSQEPLVGEAEIPGQPRLLGDVVLSPEIVKKDAVETKSPFETEFLAAAIHGLLHLLGYDHKTGEQEKVMVAREEALLEIALEYPG